MTAQKNINTASLSRNNIFSGIYQRFGLGSVLDGIVRRPVRNRFFDDDGRWDGEEDKTGI
jgi:hypothetical protein